MTITTTIEYKKNRITNPNYQTEGETYISIFSLNPDKMTTIYHKNGNAEIELTDAERGNILEFGNYQDEQLTIKVAIVMSVEIDHITISYKTSLEEAIFNQ